MFAGSSFCEVTKLATIEQGSINPRPGVPDFHLIVLTTIHLLSLSLFQSTRIQLHHAFLPGKSQEGIHG